MTAFILCTGMPRSGSTWSYNAVRALLRRGRPELRASGLYSEDPASAPSDGADILVVKCHTLRDPEFLDTRRPRLVHTYRDPRAAVASILAFVPLPFETALGMVVSSLAFQARVASAGGRLVAYREMLERPTRAIGEIAEYLGLAPASELVEAVAQECDVERARAVMEAIEDLPPEQVHRDDTYTFDRATLLHHNHITGAGGRWREALSEEQVETVLMAVEPWRETFPDLLDLPVLPSD